MNALRCAALSGASIVRVRHHNLPKSFKRLPTPSGIGCNLCYNCSHPMCSIQKTCVGCMWVLIAACSADNNDVSIESSAASQGALAARLLEWGFTIEIAVWIFDSVYVQTDPDTQERADYSQYYLALSVTLRAIECVADQDHLSIWNFMLRPRYGESQITLQNDLLKSSNNCVRYLVMAPSQMSDSGTEPNRVADELTAADEYMLVARSFKGERSLVFSSYKPTIDLNVAMHELRVHVQGVADAPTTGLNSFTSRELDGRIEMQSGLVRSWRTLDQITSAEDLVFQIADHPGELLTPLRIEIDAQYTNAWSYPAPCNTNGADKCLVTMMNVALTRTINRPVPFPLPLS